jgi:hypothetical protein
MFIKAFNFSRIFGAKIGLCRYIPTSALPPFC